MNITDCDIEITRHAFIRAMEREVTPDMIEATLQGGSIERFGKANLRFSKVYKNFMVICVGEMRGTAIRIFTVETKGGYDEKMFRMRRRDDRAL